MVWLKVTNELPLKDIDFLRTARADIIRSGGVCQIRRITHGKGDTLVIFRLIRRVDIPKYVDSRGRTDLDGTTLYDVIPGTRIPPSWY